MSAWAGGTGSTAGAGSEDASLESSVVESVLYYAAAGDGAALAIQLDGLSDAAMRRLHCHLVGHMLNRGLASRIEIDESLPPPE